jgi:hypothetical protein
LSSVAARSVKVNATIELGSAPSAIRSATRREIDSVFPDPAHAITWRSPPRYEMTRRWASESVIGAGAGAGPAAVDMDCRRLPWIR